MKGRTYCQTLIGFSALLVTLALAAIPASAQEEMPSQVNLQLTGLVNTDSTGNGITNHATHSAGLLASYTYLFKKWAGVEGSYGYSRNTQNYLADSFGTTGVQTNLHEFAGAILFRIPTHTGKVCPYALAGGGALEFGPTSDIGNAADAAWDDDGHSRLHGPGADRERLGGRYSGRHLRAGLLAVPAADRGGAVPGAVAGREAANAPHGASAIAPA